MSFKAIVLLSLFVTSLHAKHATLAVSNIKELQEIFFGFKNTCLTEEVYDQTVSPFVRQATELRVIKHCFNNAKSPECMHVMFYVACLNESMFIKKCSNSKKNINRVEKMASKLEYAIEQLGNNEIDAKKELESLQNISNQAVNAFYHKVSRPRRLWTKLISKIS